VRSTEVRKLKVYRRLAIAEVREELRRAGLSMPTWLASCMTGLSGLVLPDDLQLKVIVAGSAATVIEQFSRFARRGVDSSISRNMRLYPFMRERQLIPFAYTLCHGYILTASKGAGNDRQLLYYNADETKIVFVGTRIERRGGSELLSKVVNSECLIETMTALSENIKPRGKRPL